jgi:hypothetical protein
MKLGFEKSVNTDVSPVSTQYYAKRNINKWRQKDHSQKLMDTFKPPKKVKSQLKTIKESHELNQEMWDYQKEVARYHIDAKHEESDEKRLELYKNAQEIIKATSARNQTDIASKIARYAKTKRDGSQLNESNDTTRRSKKLDTSLVIIPERMKFKVPATVTQNIRSSFQVKTVPLRTEGTRMSVRSREIVNSMSALSHDEEVKIIDSEELTLHYPISHMTDLKRNIKTASTATHRNNNSIPRLSFMHKQITSTDNTTEESNANDMSQADLSSRMPQQRIIQSGRPLKPNRF